MEEKGFDSLSQFRGNMAVKPNEEASMFFRTQFMKHFAQI
jgi:hypothetical protein